MVLPVAALGAAAGAAGAGYAAGQTAEATGDVLQQGIDEINQIMMAMDSTIASFDAADWVEAIRKWWHGDDYRPLFTKPIVVKVSALRIVLLIMVACLAQGVWRFNQSNGRLPEPGELLSNFGLRSWFELFPSLTSLNTSVQNATAGPQSSPVWGWPLASAAGWNFPVLTAVDRGAREFNKSLGLPETIG